MKTKLSIELPELKDFLRGLDMHSVHRDLADAEQALAHAEHDLASAKQTLADRTREAEALPARVRAGEATALDLEEALRRQRAAALIVPQHERTVAEMAQSLRGEMGRATERRQAEVYRRLETLRTAAAQLSPILEHLLDLELELSHVLDPQNLGLGIEWPRCWAHELEIRNARSAIASVNLSSAGGFKAVHFPEKKQAAAR